MKNTIFKQLNWGLVFTAFIGITLSLISIRFIQYMPEIHSFKALSFLVSGIFSHFVAYSMLVYLVLIVPLSLILFKWPKLVKAVFIIIATLATLLLVADTVVYGIYRFHISGFVIDMLLTAGNDVIDLSMTTWAVVVGVFFVCLLSFYGFAKFTDKLVQSPKIKLFRRGYLGLFFICFFYAHILHLFADANYDREITSLVRHIPLFTPTTGKRAMLRYGLVNPEKARDAGLNLKVEVASNVNYPKAAMQISAPEKPLNLLVIMLDSWRYDSLNAENMPVLSEFSKKANIQRYEQHYSGSNSTRTGVFNLFYGLPGSYWQAFYTTQKPPVLMSAFKEYGYRMGVYGSAPLNSPAFDRTIFSNVEDLQILTAGNSPWQRDVSITDSWLSFIDEQPAQQAFFGFLFYDAAHGYSVDTKAEQPYQPALARSEHLALGPDYDATALFNLYKNAVYQIDLQLARVFEQLEDKNLLDNTVVIVTSDHGEEFNDNGLNYWGHGSNYSDVQLRVPLVVHWPGKTQQSFDHQTSHADISTTLMEELFDVQNPRSDYTHGVHLNTQERTDWFIAGSYVNYAIVAPDWRLVTYKNGSYETTDKDAKPTPDFIIPTKIALKAMQRLSEFYK